MPIAFAVRQIVPPDLHVAFADGIDRSAVVDWTGGEPWNVVLAKAVQPLGYHVSIAASTVHIDR